MVKRFKLEVLKKLSVKELRKICKSFGIKIYTHTRGFKKDELIEKIMCINSVGETINKQYKGSEERKMGKIKVSVVKKSNEQINQTYEPEFTEVPRTRSFDYSRMVVGSFVAFRFRDKADTAKIFAINRKQRLIKVETKLGTQYLVPFERILWVKLNPEDLWPKPVFMELKGHNKCRWEGVEDEPYKRNKRECVKII